MNEKQPAAARQATPDAVIVNKQSSKDKKAAKSETPASETTTASTTKPSRAKKVYSKFQYRDQIFKVGDICRFFQEANVPDLLGKIMQICSTDPNHPDFAKIKVRWFYQKRDLFKTKLSKSELMQIADDVEVFPTNHYQNVYVQTINGKVKVLTLDEFELLAPVPHDTFFTRAEFDPKKKAFKPEYSDWEKFCSCSKPQNPLQTYIQCDLCEEWFHPECEGTTAAVEDFSCKGCLAEK